jgi:hypothetical protein
MRDDVEAPTRAELYKNYLLSTMMGGCGHLLHDGWVGGCDYMMGGCDRL